jgi:hypothetical protein
LGQSPGIPEHLRPLFGVLDDVDHIAHVYYVRRSAFAIRAVRRVPASASDPQSRQPLQIVTMATAIVQDVIIDSEGGIP